MKRLIAAVFGWLAVVSMPAQAAWFEASSDHFVIYGDGSETWIREFASKLETLDAGIRYVSNMSDPPAERSNRLIVYVM